MTKHTLSRIVILALAIIGAGTLLICGAIVGPYLALVGIAQFASTATIALPAETYIPATIAFHPTADPRPTNTADSCLRWDQVTASMKGQKVCMRGVITNFIQTRKVGTRYEFSEGPNRFFLISAGWEIIDPKSGKTLGPGTCIQVNDVVRVQSGVPYMNLDDQIHGGVFAETLFSFNPADCQ